MTDSVHERNLSESRRVSERFRFGISPKPGGIRRDSVFRPGRDSDQTVTVVAPQQRESLTTFAVVWDFDHGFQQKFPQGSG